MEYIYVNKDKMTTQLMATSSVGPGSLRPNMEAFGVDSGFG